MNNDTLRSLPSVHALSDDVAGKAFKKDDDDPM